MRGSKYWERQFWRWGVGVVLFALGVAWGQLASPLYQRQPIIIEPGTSRKAQPAELRQLTRVTPRPSPAAIELPAGYGENSFLASVRGKKYYFPFCAAAKRIKKSNRVWFRTEAEARAAGYTPSRCVEKAKQNQQGRRESKK
jgi:hypothetical protein